MEHFDDKTENIEVYLVRFEEREDYAALKQALLVQFELTAEAYHKIFRGSRLERRKTYVNLCDRLDKYLCRWHAFSQVPETFDGLASLILSEQLLECMSPEVTVYVKEQQAYRPADIALAANRKSTSSHASTEPSSLANSPTTSSSKKPLLATGDSVLTAEVLHGLNLVEKHHSFNSSNSSSDLYKKMFPVSAIASGFSCSERKAAYKSTFGIFPYLAELQRKAVLSEKDYVLLFDETLNGQLQSKQLDVHVRYWNAVV
ncbi:zinc finger protein [Biomphalaria pfeifferi]|uniref:Zinc finger protein n=1 Tax=Biomphalaria pfeifferi TaxID=112525 RepID=A0AAD8B894_BIOPF|nr:zinc finger protein [Biomphalaria pfeifferi]